MKKEEKKSEREDNNWDVRYTEAMTERDTINQETSMKHISNDSIKENIESEKYLQYQKRAMTKISIFYLCVAMLLKC